MSSMVFAGHVCNSMAQSDCLDTDGCQWVRAGKGGRRAYCRSERKNLLIPVDDLPVKYETYHVCSDEGCYYKLPRAPAWYKYPTKRYGYPYFEAGDTLLTAVSALGGGAQVSVAQSKDITDSQNQAQFLVVYFDSSVNKFVTKQVFAVPIASSLAAAAGEVGLDQLRLVALKERGMNVLHWPLLVDMAGTSLNMLITNVFIGKKTSDATFVAPDEKVLKTYFKDTSIEAVEKAVKDDTTTYTLK